MAEKDISICTREDYKTYVLQYQDQVKKYLSRINALIADKSVSSMMQFIRIFGEPGVLEYYVPASQEFNYAHVIANIVVDEVQKRKTASFFMQGNSIEELIRVIQQIKFFLWEIEFECGTDAEMRLCEYMSLRKITPEAMSMIIFTGGMDKKKCYLTLACLYLEHREAEYARCILRYGIERLPEAEELTVMYQQLCEKMGTDGQENKGDLV